MNIYNYPDNILFQECVEKLVSDVKIISQEETRNVWNLFIKTIPILDWGMINWNIFGLKQSIDDSENINILLKKLLGKNYDESIYILWNDASLPVIKTNISLALEYIDDIKCVAPDTWFFNISDGYVIEFFHEGVITIGLINTINDVARQK